MAFDPSIIVNKVNPWLNTRPRYEGWGRAEFASPKGAIEGAATVSFTLNGAATVVMDAEHIDAPDLSAFSLQQLPSESHDYRIHGGFNPCVSVTVKTETGQFTATDRILQHGIPGFQPQGKLRLQPLHSRYEAREPAPAKYWVLPLSNFVLDHWPWPQHYPELDNHPLRVFPKTGIPAGISGDDLDATTWVNQRNAMVTFLVNGHAGFIERLPNYRRKLKQLRRGSASRLINAVMVGPAHVETVDFADGEGVFPVDVIGLMTLATGVPVGAPWIEFRDEHGGLVRRIHVRFGSSAYHKGHAALYDYPDNAIGYLLTCAFSSPEFGKKHLRVSTTHAVAAAKSSSIESRFISVSRGFETLCRYHKIHEEDLRANLRADQKSAVQNAIDVASKEIRALAKSETEAARKRALERIADKVLGSQQKEHDFGLKFVALLRCYGFADPDIVESHMAINSNPLSKSWAGLVAYYRNAAVHDAYFEFQQREQLYGILRVLDHLHDLLLRIIFKNLRYDGPYQPPIPPMTRQKKVDWVTQTTPVQALGYF